MKNTAILKSVEEIPFTVEYEYIPPVAAYISGPPEACYPAEDLEVNLISVKIGEGNKAINILSALNEHLLHAITLSCLDDAADNLRAADEARGEAAADRMMEEAYEQSNPES